MSILAVNFKHLYQRRGAWFWHFLILCQIGIVIIPFREGLNRCLGYLIISFLTGMMSGAMQKEILIKPFSFCMPGHRQVFRTFVFRIGVVVNLLLGCLFASYPATAPTNIILVALVGGFLGMIVYLYAVHVSFIEQAKPSGAGVPLLIIGMIFFKWDIPLQNVMLAQPILIIAICAGVCVWAWRLLGQDFLARMYCGKLAMGMFDNMNPDKVRRYRQAQADRNASRTKLRFFDNLHGFFLTMMKRYDFLSRGRYIWGNLYMGFGQFFGLWRGTNGLGFLALLAFFLLAFGFMGQENDEGYKGLINFLFIIPAFSAIGMELIPCRSMLFPAGRKDRFFAAAVLALMMTLLIMVLLLVMTGISVYLESVLPEITFEGKTHDYHPMEISRFYLFFIFMPVALSFAVFFPRATWLKIVFLIVFMQAWTLLETFRVLDLIDVIDLVGVVGVILFLWTAFFAILRYYCTKRPLVGQKV